MAESSRQIGAYLRDAQDADGGGFRVRMRGRSPVDKLVLTFDADGGVVDVKSRPIYMRYDATTKVIGAIAGMWERAKEGCAEAANLAAAEVRDWVVDRAGKEMPLPARDISSVVSIRNIATVDDPAAVISIKQAPVSLIRFGAFETPAGVASTPIRRDGLQLRPRAFIARGRAGTAVFRRLGKARVPIEELYGPSVRDFVVSIESEAQDKAQGSLFRNLMNVRDRIVNEAVGRGGFRS